MPSRTYLTLIGLAWALCEPCTVVGVREIPWECFSLMQHETITVQVRALKEFRALRRNGRAAPLLAERETLVSTPT